MKKFREILAITVAAVMLACGMPLLYACADKADGDTLDSDLIPKEPVVYYSEYGAVGDGVTDDFKAIRAAHDYANKNGIAVAADRGATYYIGGDEDESKTHDKAINIKTNTYWQDARFIIDDSEIAEGSAIRTKHIFTVYPTKYQRSVDVPEGYSLTAGQKSIGIKPGEKSLVVMVNSNKKDFDRYGHNQSFDRRDVIIVDADGNVDESTPIVWDFTEVTGITVYPVEDEPLTVCGGEFVTINNKWQNCGTYFNRALNVSRSNTLIYKVTHRVEGEGETGAPYNGFFTSGYTYNVTFKECKMTGRKYYSSGTYDTSATGCINISWINCTQLNDIKDTSLWGIMGTNYCKNMTMDGCTLSRFDAHKGMYGGSIRNSEIGMELCFVGYGTLTIENVHRYGAHFFALRKDYDSFWDGDIIIKNCTLTTKDKLSFLCECSWVDHDFGYACRYPKTITLDNYKVEYTGTAQSPQHNVYRGLDELTPEGVANSKNPLGMTETVTVTNSGEVFDKVSNNPNGLFDGVTLVQR